MNKFNGSLECLYLLFSYNLLIRLRLIKFRAWPRRGLNHNRAGDAAYVGFCGHLRVCCYGGPYGGLYGHHPYVYFCGVWAA